MPMDADECGNYLRLSAFIGGSIASYDGNKSNRESRESARMNAEN
jgi:hypothetical protein